MSGIWLREPVLLKAYRQHVADRDTTQFVRAVTGVYVPGSLERLAAHHDSETRRGAIFALGLIGDFEANDTVGRAMQDEDAGVRQLAGVACRSIWNRFGDASQRRQLAETIRLNAAEQYQEALDEASELVGAAPAFAEAWYQRGAAHFQLGNMATSMQDWYQTLEYNPYQFVAATAIGNAYLHLGNPVSALEAFQRALRVNPDLPHLQAQVAALRRHLDGP